MKKKVEMSLTSISLQAAMAQQRHPRTRQLTLLAVHLEPKQLKLDLSMFPLHPKLSRRCQMYHASNPTRRAIQKHIIRTCPHEAGADIKLSHMQMSESNLQRAWSTGDSLSTSTSSINSPGSEQ